jgi:hypothetical protein
MLGKRPCRAEARAHAFTQGLLNTIRKTHLFNSLWEVQS